MITDIEVPVAADADAILHWSVGSISHTFSSGANVGVGYSSAAAENLASALRFQDVPIPREAEIQSATVRLEAVASQAEVVVNAKIDGLASDDSDTPTHAEFDGGSVGGSGHGRASANRTTAQVAWDNIPATTIGVNFDSPDISSVIQEIIDRSGWFKGNALTLFVGDEDEESDQVDDHIRSGLYTAPRPRLIITYVDVLADPAIFQVSLGEIPQTLGRLAAKKLQEDTQAQVE